MMPCEVLIIKKDIYACPQPFLPLVLLALQWSNKQTAAGPLLGVVWGINEVVAHRSICYTVLMNYKDMALLTRLPLTAPDIAEEAGLLLFLRWLAFNGDKVNFSICQSALQPISCALHCAIVSLSIAIHLDFFDAPRHHHRKWKDVMSPSKYHGRLKMNLNFKVSKNPQFYSFINTQANRLQLIHLLF